MKHLLAVMVLMGLAAALPAQTLSWGEITLTSSSPYTAVANVVLTGAGTTNAGLIAGLQFDLFFPSSFSSYLNAQSVALGAASTAASKEISSTALPAANDPFNGKGTALPANNIGVRSIVIGAGLNDASVSSTGGPSTITDVAGGEVVATVTVTGAPASGETLTFANLFATSAGANNVAASTIPLTVGVGSNDPTGSGTLNLYNTYLAGGVYPSTSDAVRSFGSGSLQLNDLLQVLFAVTKLTVAGYPVPACGTDRFDALDLYPFDTATARGGLRDGKGTLSLNDLLVELSMVTKLPGYTTPPLRISAPYTCTGGTAMTANGATPAGRARVAPAVQATLSLGRTERGLAGQDRVPIYLESHRDFSRLGLTFGLGDQQSQLQFQPTAGLTPSILQDSTGGIAGAVAVAWLRGLDVRAGQRLLLGYVVGPAGSAANLKVTGVSASVIDTFEEIGLDVSGATLVQQ